MVFPLTGSGEFSSHGGGRERKDKDVDANDRWAPPKPLLTMLIHGVSMIVKIQLP